MRNASKLILAALMAFVVSACDKKGDDSKPPAKEEPKLVAPESAPAPASAKANKETCEKVAQHQIDIETDAQMKSALKSSLQGLIDQCMQSNQKAAECMLTAKDGPAFADCVLNNR
jgi:hypothetical protein